MKRLLTRLLLVMWCVFSLPALAAGPALPPATVERLQHLEQQLATGDMADVAAEAQRQAERLGSSGASGWAKALYLQLGANAEAKRGRDAHAADLFAQARDISVAPLAQRVSWLEREAKLRLRAGQMENGVALLERWAEQAYPAPSDLWLLAQVQAHQGNWSSAARWLKRARHATSALSSRQTELAAVIYQHAGQNDAAVKMIEAQIDRDAQDAQIWQRAAALYQRIGQPGRAAALWEAGWRRGILKGSEALERRIALHMAGGTPARGAEILAQALMKGELEPTPERQRQLAQAWTMARDRDHALNAWQTLADQTHEARDWRQLGELAYGWGNWPLAIKGLSNARQAGDSARGRLWLLQGVAAYEQGDREAARRAFRQAANSQEVAEQAEAWQNMLAQSNSESSGETEPQRGNT
ncbi:tetratricopeptide repeat protein [Phytohalomonas tamaricis]|uniref:tetratricopeptide repeat protein n=1 Tax=Phytohalomonas tamaricis TaxID=2081032 RepID=UPI000D0AC4A5|nr:hypothetical protein [Phytohalomonas tamaricis]